MRATSLYEDILRALAAEADTWESDTGRGKGGKEKYDERVGVSKGLRRAIDLVMETARKRKEDDDDGS